MILRFHVHIRACDSRCLCTVLRRVIFRALSKSISSARHVALGHSKFFSFCSSHPPLCASLTGINSIPRATSSRDGQSCHLIDFTPIICAQCTEELSRKSGYCRPGRGRDLVKLRDSRDLHHVACRDLEDTDMKTVKLKRKVDEVFDPIRELRNPRRRTTEEEDLNDSLGCLGQLVKDTAGISETLSCDLSDRE